MTDTYKHLLNDLVCLIAKLYNESQNHSDQFESGSEFAYYRVLDLIYQQLISFQMTEDFIMNEPMIGQSYTAFPDDKSSL